MTSLINLSGKVALVTGARRGIGLACVELLAAHGASVILNDVHEPDTITALANDLEKRYKRSFWALPADAANDKAVTSLYQTLFQRAKRLDILVANAGVMEDALIGMITPGQIEHTLGVNVTGVINHIQMAARLMKRGQGGSIVATASIVGRFGNKGQLLYGASKAGVIGAVISAAKELAPSNIRVNAIAPGFIDTAMTQSLPATVRNEMMAAIGMKRIGSPEDVARTVLFLTSDLSSYVTGQVIGVDGGMVI